MYIQIDGIECKRVCLHVCILRHAKRPLQIALLVHPYVRSLSVIVSSRKLQLLDSLASLSPPFSLKPPPVPLQLEVFMTSFLIFQNHFKHYAEKCPKPYLIIGGLSTLGHTIIGLAMLAEFSFLASICQISKKKESNRQTTEGGPGLPKCPKRGQPCE